MGVSRASELNERKKAMKVQAKVEPVAASATMHIQTTRRDLLPALTRATLATARRSTIPILSNVLIEAADGAVRVVGDDTEINIAVTFQAPTNIEGRTTVPGKTLLAMVKALDLDDHFGRGHAVDQHLVARRQRDRASQRDLGAGYVSHSHEFLRISLLVGHLLDRGR